MADDADTGGVTLAEHTAGDDPVKAARARAERARRAAEASAKAAAAAEEAALEAERALDDDPGDSDGVSAAPPAEVDGEQGHDSGSAAVVDDAVEDDVAEGDTGKDEDGPADGPGNGDPGTAHRSRKTLVIGAVAVLLLIAGIVVNVLLYLDHGDRTDAQTRRDRYVEVAKQTVVNMTSLDHEHAQRDVNRVLASATGEFRTDFEKRGAAFTEVIQKSKVATKGQVALAGVEKENPDGSLVVMIASNSQVSNAAGAQNEDRAWRLRVTVVDVDGTPKVSKVEFVP